MKVKILFILILVNLFAVQAFAQKKKVPVVFFTLDGITSSITWIDIVVDGITIGQIQSNATFEPEDCDYAIYPCYKVELEPGEHEIKYRTAAGTRTSILTVGSRSSCVRMRLIADSDGNYSSSGGGSYSSSGGSSSSSGSSGGYGSRSSNDDLKNIGIAYAVLIAAITVPLVSNDIYMNYIEGQFNRGFNFGFRNTMNEHIDVEVGTTYSQWQNRDWFSKSTQQKPGVWTLDFATLYNIFPKDRRKKLMVNPYIGIGMSVLPLRKETQAQFAVGGVAGIALGSRFKGHLRYKWLKDWAHNQVMIHQVEVGFSLTYKYGWKFSDQ